ncbi:ATP-binding protein [Saccharothrix longispora]|uniref:Anti-sigma regulatory factor (Ser/Thr protein kinase) n=1 Tax=Saccharothrix longispora TaxID=33920 RepID=A0ABU1PQN6_9PSEU|nr:ATP-binding protein [Saccharothrix longispora]MDR6592970.1 anti-sigma regulatory factor (Ser/Thr protein kinase) [Saccharothrix longispora]
MNSLDLPDDGVDRHVDDPPSAAAVGEWLRQVAYGVDPRHVADLALITTELLANAHRHAEGPWRVRVFRVEGAVRVEVQDRSPSLLPVLGRADRPDSGSGLLLVNRLSVHWGVSLAAQHKVVWAEVPA